MYTLTISPPSQQPIFAKQKFTVTSVTIPMDCWSNWDSYRHPKSHTLD